MKLKLAILSALAAVSVLTQPAQAVPITGNIGFSGGAILNSTTANTATQVTGWTGVTVTERSGGFSSVALTTPVNLFSPWNFNSGALNNFWNIPPNFQFNLSSSSVFFQGGGFVNVILTGTVIATGYDATAFTGSFQVADPSANGVSTFTSRLSFNSVPDGGTTALLLGSALSGLALLRRKLAA